MLDYADEIGIDDLPAQIFSTVRDEKTRQLAALKAPWAQWCDELRDLLNAAVAEKKSGWPQATGPLFRPVAG
ncbi:hypothetical protein OS42_20160 [Dickeya oryzae]